MYNFPDSITYPYKATLKIKCQKNEFTYADTAIQCQDKTLQMIHLFSQPSILPIGKKKTLHGRYTTDASAWDSVNAVKLSSRDKKNVPTK